MGNPKLGKGGQTGGVKSGKHEINTAKVLSNIIFFPRKLSIKVRKFMITKKSKQLIITRFSTSRSFLRRSISWWCWLIGTGMCDLSLIMKLPSKQVFSQSQQ